MLAYKLYSFKDLSLDQLYEILVLRQEVFIVEQDCPYLDADNKDQVSYHLCGVDKKDSILAYTRIVPIGEIYEKYVSIGRVIVAESARGTGEGYRLMEESIKACDKLYPSIPIKISAQSHLKSYYEKLGFEQIGVGYLEDDIPHLAMIREYK